MSSKREDTAQAGADEDGTGDSRVGQRTVRREDRRLLTGRADYTNDLADSSTAHLVFVRSAHGHADIETVDTSGAVGRSGVKRVITWDDVAESESPGVLPVNTDALDVEVPGHPVLARERVRYHGQPIAAVIAETQSGAVDAAREVQVDYKPRDVVADPIAATAGEAPTLFEAAQDNIAVETHLGDSDQTARAFADADNMVELELRNNRVIPSALEPRAAVARPEGDGVLVEMTSQSPHGHRRKLSHTLGLPERDIRVIAPDVGGGFGHKGHHHPGEAMAAWYAYTHGRSVQWSATRPENARAGAHGRDHRTTASLAFDADGTFRGLRAETHANAGGYALGSGAAMPGFYGRLLAGQYDIPAIHCETKSVFTTTAPIHSYRGAGRPEAIYVVERLVKRAAQELTVDPATLRRRNQLPEDGFPHETAVGASYDSGQYARALDKALAGLDHDGIDEETGRDDQGRYTGIGLACYVESTGGGYESGVVRVHPDGSVSVYAGTHSHGQGHATTYAQIVADELDVSPDEIAVIEGDTERIPKGTGTFGSRSAITGGNAVAESAKRVRRKAREVAAICLDTAPENLIDDGSGFRVVGDTERTVDWATVAREAYGSGLEDLEPGLEATTFYEPDGTAYTFGTHVAVVAVDPRTGEIEIKRYVAVDDPGPQINPTIVEGQVHGGVAQGLGQALFEQARYDAQGRLQTDSLSTYGVPRAEQLPLLETRSTETPSPRNPLGVKGIGEAGTIAAPPAIVNAVIDALEPLGVEHIDMPLTAEKVWEAIPAEHRNP